MLYFMLVAGPKLMDSGIKQEFLKILFLWQGIYMLFKILIRKFVCMFIRTMQV